MAASEKNKRAGWSARHAGMGVGLLTEIGAWRAKRNHKDEQKTRD